MAMSRGRERRRDDVCEAEGALLDHLEQKWRQMVLRNGRAAPGLEVASIEIGLELEGERLGEYVWERAVAGVSSLVRLGCFL
jgi:hypothetical protein